MAIKSVRDYIEKVVTGGNTHSSEFRKNTSASGTAAGLWYDLSMTPNHPVANYYASTPLESEVLLGRNGLQHGSNQSPSKKYLKRVSLMSAPPMNALVLDYLLYYPFIDGDSLEDQLLVNSTPLPRYTDGKGVKAIVVAQGVYAGNGTFVINYTNQNGVSGRISRLCTSNASGLVGTVITSGNSATNYGQFGWHIPLLEGDTGIRSVESFTFKSTNGGIFALVLVKDLGLVTIREAGSPGEKDFLIDSGMNMPEIQDGAYLNLIVSSLQSIASQSIFGSLQVVWG